MKTYLVTGGAGFIGSYLCEALLKKGHKVINIDNFDDFYSIKIKKQNIVDSLKNKNYILEKIDIRNLNKLEKIFNTYNINHIIHIAAMAGVLPSIIDPILYHQVNINGTLNLLECAKKYGIKNFILASSSSVYGNNEKSPFKETDIVDFPISPYAATKKSCEIICHSYHHLYNINIACLRFFTVYGERQRPDLAIHKFTKLIQQEKPIPFFGNGLTKRDYTYIDDIISGIVKAIDFIEINKKVYEIFNLGNSKTITLKQMVKSIEKELGKKAILNKLPKQAGDVDKTFADISKAIQLLDYNPQTTFEVGIKQFIKWYNEKLIM